MVLVGMESPQEVQKMIYGDRGGPPMIPLELANQRPRPQKRRGTPRKAMPVEKLLASMKQQKDVGENDLSASELPGDFPPELAYRALAAYALLRTLSVHLRLSPFTPNVFLRSLYLPYPNRLSGQIHVALLRILLPNLQMGYSYKARGGAVGVHKKRLVDGVRWPLRAGDNLTFLDSVTWPLFYDDYVHLTADRLWAAMSDEDLMLDFRNVGMQIKQIEDDDDVNDDSDEEESDIVMSSLTVPTVSRTQAAQIQSPPEEILPGPRSGGRARQARSEAGRLEPPRDVVETADSDRGEIGDSDSEYGNDADEDDDRAWAPRSQRKRRKKPRKGKIPRSAKSANGKCSSKELTPIKEPAKAVSSKISKMEKSRHPEFANETPAKRGDASGRRAPPIPQVPEPATPETPRQVSKVLDVELPGNNDQLSSPAAFECQLRLSGTPSSRPKPITSPPNGGGSRVLSVIVASPVLSNRRADPKILIEQKVKTTSVDSLRDQKADPILEGQMNYSNQVVNESSVMSTSDSTSKNDLPTCFGETGIQNGNATIPVEKTLSQGGESSNCTELGIDSHEQKVNNDVISIVKDKLERLDSESKSVEVVKPGSKPLETISSAISGLPEENSETNEDKHDVRDTPVAEPEKNHQGFNLVDQNADLNSSLAGTLTKNDTTGTKHQNGHAVDESDVVAAEPPTIGSKLKLENDSVKNTEHSTKLGSSEKSDQCYYSELAEKSVDKFQEFEACSQFSDAEEDLTIMPSSSPCGRLASEMGYEELPASKERASVGERQTSSSQLPSEIENIRETDSPLASLRAATMKMRSSIESASTLASDPLEKASGRKRPRSLPSKEKSSVFHDSQIALSKSKPSASSGETCLSPAAKLDAGRRRRRLLPLMKRQHPNSIVQSSQETEKQGINKSVGIGASVFKSNDSESQAAIPLRTKANVAGQSTQLEKTAKKDTLAVDPSPPSKKLKFDGKKDEPPSSGKRPRGRPRKLPMHSGEPIRKKQKKSCSSTQGSGPPADSGRTPPEPFFQHSHVVSVDEQRRLQHLQMQQLQMQSRALAYQSPYPPISPSMNAYMHNWSRGSVVPGFLPFGISALHFSQIQAFRAAQLQRSMMAGIPVHSSVAPIKGNSALSKSLTKVAEEEGGPKGRPHEVPQEIADQLQNFISGVGTSKDEHIRCTAETMADEKFCNDFDDIRHSSRWPQFRPISALRSGVPSYRLPLERKLDVLEFLIDELLAIDVISAEFSKRQAISDCYGFPYGSLPSDAEFETLENEDECGVCGGEGELLCCDGCVGSYHRACLDMSESQVLPEGKWLCPECRVVDPANFGPLRGGRKASLDWFTIEDMRAAGEKHAMSSVDEVKVKSEHVGWEDAGKPMNDQQSTVVDLEKEGLASGQAICVNAESEIEDNTEGKCLSANREAWNEPPARARSKSEEEGIEFLVIHGFVFCRRSGHSFSGEDPKLEPPRPFIKLTKDEIKHQLDKFGSKVASSWPFAQVPLDSPSSGSRFPSVKLYLAPLESFDPSFYISKYRKAPIPQFMLAGAASIQRNLFLSDYESECSQSNTYRVTEALMRDMTRDKNVADCLTADTSLFDPYNLIRGYLVRLEATLRKACLLNAFWETGTKKPRCEVWSNSVRKCKSVNRLAVLFLKLVNQINCRAFTQSWFHNPLSKGSEPQTVSERSYLSLPEGWNIESELRRRRWERTPISSILALLADEDCPLDDIVQGIRTDMRRETVTRSKRKQFKNLDSGSAQLLSLHDHTKSLHKDDAADMEIPGTAKTLASDESKLVSDERPNNAQALTSKHEQTALAAFQNEPLSARETLTESGAAQSAEVETPLQIELHALQRFSRIFPFCETDSPARENVHPKEAEKSEASSGVASPLCPSDQMDLGSTEEAGVDRRNGDKSEEFLEDSQGTESKGTNEKESSKETKRRTRRSGRIHTRHTADVGDSTLMPLTLATIVAENPHPSLTPMELFVEEQKKQKLPELEKLLKVSFQKQIHWPVAGRIPFATLGNLSPSDMKCLARNAGSIMAPNVVYHTAHEVGQVCIGHMWRKSTEQCRGLEELLLQIRVFESFLDRSVSKGFWKNRRK